MSGDAGGSTFTRARRNLVIMAAIVLVYATGGITIKPGDATSYAGFGFKFGDGWIVEVWLVVFLLYFLWRYISSLNGERLYAGLINNINSALSEISVPMAKEYFNMLYPGIWDGDTDAYSEHTIQGVAQQFYKGFDFGTINVPVLALQSHDSKPIYQNSIKKSDKDFFIMPDSIAYQLAKKIYRRQLLTHNHFSEVIWPFYVAGIALDVLFIRWGYKVGQLYFGT